MIAKVRIAPVEQWCALALSFVELEPSIAALAGMEIEIDTASMEWVDFGHGEKVRAWRETKESLKRTQKILGFRSGTHWCEHMLELD